MNRGTVSLLLITVIVAILVSISIVLMGSNRSPAPLQPTSSIPNSQVTEVTTQPSKPTSDRTPSPLQGEPTQRPLRVEAAGEWDVVVLGQVDACYLCQRGLPNVSYTKVLAGKIPNGQTEGMLDVAGVAAHLLPEGGVPIYESQQEVIVFLKSVVVPGQEDKVIYTVVDVMKATPENLALFLGH